MTKDLILSARSVLSQYLKGGMQTDEHHRATLKMEDEAFLKARDYLISQQCIHAMGSFHRPTNKAIDGMKDLAKLLPT